MKKLPDITARLIEFGQSRHGVSFGWKADFARSLGMSIQGLNPYLTGINMPGKTLQQRLRAVGCDIEWLMTGQQSSVVSENIGSYGPIGAVPVIGKIMATPDGKQYFEDLPEGISVPYFKGNYFALLIENDSLINAPDGDHSMELYPGDLCIFEANKQPRNGDIVAVQLKQSNKRMVKIFKHKSGDGAELLSANKFRNYPAVKINKEEVATFGVFVTKLKLTNAEKRRLGIKD